MAYSTPEDLLMGGIPLPVYLDPIKVIQDADNEIDSYIGFAYKTPLELADNDQNPIVRPARLLIQRISSHLATGRLILAVASPIEQAQVHAYGASLVKGAIETLNQIANGAIILEGAPRNEGDKPEPNGPMITNVDERSNVEAFYDRFTQPILFPGSGRGIFP